MGGLGGHIKHLHEDPSLNFREIKDIFKKINDGKMLVTEKTDGQNCYLSYSVLEGKAKAARNQKNILDGGIPLENISNLTENKNVQNSFLEAIKTFEQTVTKFPIDEQLDIFGPNANYYYNCEIQDPTNANVLIYDNKLINFHRSNHLKFNKFNKKVTQEKLGKQFLKLEKLLKENKSINEQVSDGFIVRTNEIRKLNALQDKKIYDNSLKKLQNEIKTYRLSDDSTLSEYVLNRLNKIVENIFPEIPRKTKGQLLKKVMRADGVTNKDVYDSLNRSNSPHLVEKVKALLDSEKELYKEALSSIEEIITEFGAGFLKEFQSSYIKESNKEVERLKGKLKEIFDIVGSSGDAQAQNYLNNQFNRIKDINNINSSCEGIVFRYNDNLYKMTGLFSPLNQILGMTKYKRGNIQPLNPIMITNENKTAVISWGRFNPPTIGHEIVFKFANDLAKQNKADFFIIPTKTTDKEKNPLTIQEKITYLNKIFPEYTNNLINNLQINTIIEAAKYFSNKGYSNLKLVVGSDRKQQFEILNKYNNKDYKFNSIEIVSAGERLDEGEGAASMSASKMREAAIEGNIDAFMKGVAGRLDLEEGVQLMNLIRSRIEVVEDNKKKFLQPVSPSLLAEVIRKSANKWCVLSKSKTKDGKRKKLGCYNSRNGAKKRLRQVEYFKTIKEEQEIEETIAMSAGGVQGSPASNKNPWNKNKVVYLEEDEVEESAMNPFYARDMETRFGISSKRDDEPSKKDVIKILIMQEEQFMINRAEFVEEIKLRKIIRENIKQKMSKRKKDILEEENKLRLVIRKLLKEGEEDTPHPITGINILKDLLKKIVPTIEKDYKYLTTDENQTKSFRAHLIKAAKDLLHLSNSPDKAAEIENELQEEVVEDPNIPQDPKFISIKKPQTITKEPVDKFSIQGMDTTGRDVAQKTFDKIRKQIETSRSMLSNKKDVSAFEDYLLTNLKLHMDVFDNEMNTSTEEPTTPEYDQQKQKLDANAPEGAADAGAGEEAPPEGAEQPPEGAEQPPEGAEQPPAPVAERRNRR